MAATTAEPLELVQGYDDRTGVPGTWRVTPGFRPGTCLLEWAPGHLTDPADWRAASTVATLVTEEYARELMARVARG